MRQRLGFIIAVFFATSVLAAKTAAQEVDPVPVTPGTEATTPEQRFFDWTRLRFPASEYAERRQRLLDAVEGLRGAILIPSAHGLSHGETFRQDDDFLYFTGLELPGSVLILDIPTRSATVFAPDRDFRFENPSRPNDFPGRPLRTDTMLVTESGIDDFRSYDQLDVLLREWARTGVPVHFNPGRDGEIRRVVTTLIPDWDPALLTLFHLQTAYPTLPLYNTYRIIANTRMIKTPLEIEAMRKSVAATESSIRAAAVRVRQGVSERELEASFEGACKENGAQRIAFASIIKSGPNSLWPWRVLSSQYDRRNRVMRDGELVIFDVGCEVDNYVSDVGRTFPVSGQFTPEQRNILEMEVAVSDAIINEIAPGVTFRELQAIAVAHIPREHRKYMQAGLFFGHHIGLSTGDPNLPDMPLRPGMVFTVEPWYYNHDIGISVFTEDVVLVTENGAEVLTSGLPRTPAELERLVRP
jgi:Xaa-Pro aminopeptidase